MCGAKFGERNDRLIDDQAIPSCNSELMHRNFIFGGEGGKGFLALGVNRDEDSSRGFSEEGSGHATWDVLARQ